jgi:hypothetical protein
LISCIDIVQISWYILICDFYNSLFCSWSKKLNWLDWYHFLWKLMFRKVACKITGNISPYSCLKTHFQAFKYISKMHFLMECILKWFCITLEFCTKFWLVFRARARSTRTPTTPATKNNVNNNNSPTRSNKSPAGLIRA